MIQHFKFSIKTISPLIIHTGEYVDSLELLPPISEDKAFTRANISKILAILPPEKGGKLLELFEQTTKMSSEQARNHLREVRSFLYKSCKDNTKLLHQVYATPLFSQKFHGNPFMQISSVFRDPLTNTPYIPGSSLKGYIRTAMLDTIRKDGGFQSLHDVPRDAQGRNEEKIDYWLMDPSLLAESKGRLISQDYFKYLKVSDAKTTYKKEHFGVIRSVNMKKEDDADIPIPTEYVPGELGLDDFDSDCIEFTGELSIQTGGPRGMQPAIPEKVLTIDFLKRSLNQFGDRSFLEGMTQLLDSRYGSIPELIALDERLNQYQKEEKTLIRLGRFCGRASKTIKVTMTGTRQPDINIHGGVSANLLDGKLAPGWCTIDFTELEG